MKVFRAAVYLLGILTIFLIVLYMFSYQSEKVFLMIYRIFTIFFLFQFGNGYSGTKWIVLYGGKAQRIGLAEKFITF